MRQLTYFELSWAIHAGCKLFRYICEATLAVQSYCSLQGGQASFATLLRTGHVWDKARPSSKGVQMNSDNTPGKEPHSRADAAGASPHEAVLKTDARACLKPCRRTSHLIPVLNLRVHLLGLPVLRRKVSSAQQQLESNALAPRLSVDSDIDNIGSIVLPLQEQAPADQGHAGRPVPACDA